MDLEFEEVDVSESVGLALHDTDRGVGAFAWTGGGDYSMTRCK